MIGGDRGLPPDTRGPIGHNAGLPTTDEPSHA